MGEKYLGRALNKAFSNIDCTPASLRTGGKTAPAAEEVTAPAQQDQFQRILSAWRDKDYFSLLQLPPPTVDEIGRPMWTCTNADVSRSYRKLSILVHPDKHAGEDARLAFEALNQTYRLLKDPSRLEEILKDASVKAKLAQEKKEATASIGERVQLNAVKNVKMKTLRKEEGQSFQSEILLQMQRRQQAASGKRHHSSQQQHHENSSDDEKAHQATVLPSSRQQNTTVGEDEDDEVRRSVLQKKRKKPSFI